MFAGKVTEVVQVVGDDGQQVNVTIRKLSRKSLAKANEARQIEFARFVSAGGKAFFDSAQQANPEVQKTPTPDQQRASRYAAYDVDAVLQAGIVSWDIEPAPTPDLIGDLDATTAKTLHEHIVDLSCGPIDAPAQAVEEGKG